MQAFFAFINPNLNKDNNFQNSQHYPGIVGKGRKDETSTFQSRKIKKKSTATRKYNFKIINKSFNRKLVLDMHPSRTSPFWRFEVIKQ